MMFQKQIQLLWRNELHRVPARVWLGTKREYVHGAPILFLYTYTTYMGLCQRDTKLERYSVWVLESFFLGRGGQSKNVTYAVCVKEGLDISYI